MSDKHTVPLGTEECYEKNGIRIYGIRNAASHGFFASLFLRSGSMHEGEGESGITHFLEHILIKNVDAVMNHKLYSTLDELGLEFNAGTYTEMVQFYIAGAAKNRGTAIEILSRLPSRIILSRESVNVERERIKAEIREASERTTLSGFTNGIVFGNTPLARQITGTALSVSKITLSRLHEYQKKLFSKGNLFFYLTGNYDDGDVEKLFELMSEHKLESDFTADNTAPRPIGFSCRPSEIYVKNADYLAVRFTFDIDMESFTLPEIDLLYDVLLSGYNSRFFIEMSEKRGLLYDVSGALERYRNIGTLHFTYELRGDNLYLALEKTVEILNSLKSSTLSDNACMKAGYTDNAYMLFDDNRELNFTFAYDNHIMNANYSGLEQRKNAYESVSAERIREIAARIFLRKNLTFTVKGKKNKIDKERVEQILCQLG